MVNIVILDGFVANPSDLDWKVIEALGKVTIYDRTPSELVVSRAKDAAIILTNKCIFNEEVMAQLPQLQYIGLLATGMNNIDLEAANARGIVVRNAVGYSTPSVAQHVFALLLELTNAVGRHSQSVHNNDWGNASDWSYSHQTLIELQDKTLGIYGLGNIGQQVAKIGLAFGMKIIATRKNRHKPKPENVRLVEMEELLTESDVLTLHAPLIAENQNFINELTLDKMKKSAFLINTGRGGLVNEADLKTALEKGKIAGAALDVLKAEPPELDHILLNTPNCIITPHQAWASKESRARLLNIVADNLRGFLG